VKIAPIKTAAFSLVEVAIAIGLSAFCLTAIFGLLPVGLNSNMASINQTEANGILTAVSADLRATPPTSPLGLSATSPLFSIIIPKNSVSTLPSAQTLYLTDDGVSSPTLVPQSRYLLTVQFQPNALTSGSSGKIATFVNLKVTWPAEAPVAYAAGSVQTFLAIDRN